MQAGRAVYDTFYRDLQLGGGVLIKGKNGQTVSGGGASWNSASATMRSIGQVQYRSGWGTASVGEMAVDLRSRQVVMKRVNFKFDLKGAM